MAGITARMGLGGQPVGLGDRRGPMASRAVPPLRVVALMAARAGQRRVSGLEGDGRDVAARAGQGVVRLVGKLDGPSPPIVPLHRYGDLNRSRGRELILIMAGLAVRLGGALVMADLAPAGRLEGQSFLL